MTSTNQQTTLATTGPSEFTVFPSLPKELREIIWKFALPDDHRVVSVLYERNTHPKARFYARPGASNPCHIIDVNPVPTTILYTSREARSAALRRYELAFDGFLQCGPIYFDFERDTLLFASCFALKRFCMDHHFPLFPQPAAVDAWQSKIRYVGVAGGLLEEADQTELIRCDKLKLLIIEEPRLNEGCRQHGSFREMEIIRTRLENAWKERRQTDDDKKLPVLNFCFLGKAKLRLGQF